MKSMIEKVFSIKALVALMIICATSGAWADFQKTNPVTGETENYTWKFVGTDVWNGTGYWQNSSGTNPSGVPAKSGDNTWDPILFDGNTININASMSVEGWNLRMGLYNGANVTMNTFVKYQGDTTMWMTVDETSQLTVGGFGGGNITDNQVIKLSVAKANGITWNVGLTSGNANNTFEYYLKGAGSVSYQAVSAANHKIKMADVTLSGTSQVASKTLVSFTSSSKTFSADATIKRLNSSGTDLNDDAHVATVNTTGTTTLTTSDAVGTCELVQTSTGIVLYWVDGDPADLNPTVYKPSISINFTTGTSLSTAADVGISEYAIPGTSWNNLIGNNGSLNTVTGVDSTGVASTISGANVTISGTRGYWKYDDNSGATTLYNGYIDDRNNGSDTPTVVVEGIPYYSYKLVVYFSNDTDGVNFGYITVNGDKYYKGDNGATVACEGTSSDKWGSADHTAWTEGGNYLVTPTILNEDETLTLVSHDLAGCRAGVAAIQIVEVKPEIGENDLEIEVDGDTTYTVSEGKTLSGTVYLTGSGTLTLSGDYKIEADTIEVSPAVTLNVNTARLDADTYIGAGTVVYDGVAPTTGKGWTESSWTGTVWLKNQTVSSFEGNQYGNSSSTIRFTGVTGFLQTNTYDSKGYVHAVPLELVDDGNTAAFTYNNGWSGYLVKVNTLKGTGTLKTQDSGLGEHIYIVDGSGFTGVFNLTGKYVYVGGSQPESTPATNPNGKLEIRSGVTMTVPSGKTWTANGGFVIDGTLNVDGTLVSTHETKAVSGSGTVVFNGKLPSPTGDAWWKNSDWDGTVQIKSTAFTGVSGVATYLEVNKYGNDGSTLELNNCSGWLPVGNTAGDNVCTVPLKVTGTLTINNGYSNRSFKINKLSGSGAIYTDNNTATVTIQVLNADDFTGYVQLNKKRVVFGETIPATYTHGQIYVGSGFSFTVPNSNAAWYGTGGITLDGELRAAALSNLGGGTTVTTTDNGVFTLITNSNADDMNTDYARLQGTGTLRLEGSAYRCISTNNFPTAMSVDNRLTTAGLLHRIPGLEITIGSLAGDGYLRSDWGGSAGDRDLKVLQAKDTTWSGKFWVGNGHRFRSLIVAPGATTAGTLTLSATHESGESTGLTVESGAKVNLTGTWVGATTVAGTFGGTGTVTGNLTFSDGATFKANASALTISGSNTVTFPSEGSVTVDLTSIELSSSGTTLISGASSIANSANLTASGAYFAVEGDGTKSLVAYAHVATYSGVKYATFADAIAAALADEGGEANLASITVVDATADLPNGYGISDNTVVKYPVALVKDGAVHSYYNAVAAAIQTVFMSLAGQYDYVEIVTGSTFDLPLGMLASIKVKNTAGAEPVLDGVADDCTWSSTSGETYTTYTKVNKPTEYTWTGGAAQHRWGNRSNWSFENNNSETETASRTPEAGDTVIFASNVADVTIGADLDVAAMRIGAVVVIAKEYSDDVAITATTGGIVLTDANASITVSGVTLSPEPTSGVDLMYVKATTSEGTTTYALQVAGEMDGTTAKIDDATAEVTVPASATAIEADPAVSSIKLEDGSAIKNSDITIKYNGTTDITGAFTVTVADNQVTIALNENGSVTISADTITVKPAVAASEPMTMPGATTAPSFNIKTIPGLYYVVRSGTDPSSLTAGSATQATTTTTGLAGPALGNEDTVRYYQISVGRTAAEAAQ